MLCITRHETDPYFNLAAEEYVMDHFDRDVFMLWRNAPAIIVGRHQNTLAEINLDYVREHDIPVVRRLSGGGGEPRAKHHQHCPSQYAFDSRPACGRTREHQHRCHGRVQGSGLRVEG